MPAKDRYHDIVVRALIKDGWTITGEQVRVDIEDRLLYLDLEAVRGSDSLIIVVEIKGFENMPSVMSYFADTIGQYVVYRAALEFNKKETPLYLAVPDAPYSTVLAEPFIQFVLHRENVSLIVFDVEREEIVQWIRR